MLRRQPWIVAFVVTATMLLAAGCGEPEAGDSGSSVVRSTVGAYFRAIEEGDGVAICSHLTDRTRRAIAQLQEATCQKAMTDEARRLPGALNDYVVTGVSVDGARAAVRLKGGDTGLEEQMKLTRVGGRWRISDAPGLGQ